jgi:hypothetical protein
MRDDASNIPSRSPKVPGAVFNCVHWERPYKASSASQAATRLCCPVAWELWVRMLLLLSDPCQCDVVIYL